MRTSGNSVVRWSDQSSSVGSSPGSCGSLPGEEIAERGAGDVDVAAVAVDEIHRHAERIVDVALEAHAGLEHERQHARARAGRCRATPRCACDRKPLGLPSVKGEQAKIAVAIGCSASDTRSFLTMSASSAKSRFTWMVAVRYIMSRPRVPTSRHVARHHLVALLGHARRLGQRPVGREADAEEADAQRLADAEHLRRRCWCVSAPISCTVSSGRAGELELAAGLER